MNHPLYHSALLRKELRQLLPLILSLGGLCLLGLIGSSTLSSTAWRFFSPGWWLIAIPVLYAVGVGPMLVGQEKETRTLQWLSSIPLTHAQLINTKLLAGIIGWGGCWVFAIAAAWLLELLLFNRLFDTNPPEHPLSSNWILYWLLSSLYLLTLGFLTAWKFNTAMVGLLAMLPLATMPSLLRFSWQYIQHPGLSLNSSRYDSTWEAHLVWLIICLIPAAWFVWQFAFQSLAPKQYASAKNNPYAPTPQADARKAQSQSVLSPMSALSWQFFQQNKLVYLSLFGSCVLFGLVVILIDDGSGYGPAFSWRPWVSIWVFVVTAWMGVMVFQSDNLQDRIRFLADRGVSPWKAWALRMAWPMLFVSVMVWLYVFDWVVQQRRGFHINNPSADAIAIALLVIFSFGQWFGQLVKQPLLSALGAPVISVLSILYVAYASQQLATPLFAMIPLAAMPLIATALMMRRWMDRRFDWKYYASHIGLLGLAAFLPIALFLFKIAQVPGMDSAMRARFEAASQQGEIDTSFANYVMLVPEPPSSVQSLNELGLAAAETASVDPYPSIQTRVDKLEAALANTSGGIQLQPDQVDVVLGETELAKLAFDQAPDEDALREAYRLQIKRLVMLAERLRLTSKLLQQDQADGIEINLLRHMGYPDSRTHFGEELWLRSAKMVSNRKLRAEMRMKALVAAWTEFHARRKDYQVGSGFGGFYPFQGSQWTEVQNFTYRKRMDHLAGVLMRLLVEGPSMDEAARVELLKQRWNGADRDLTVSYRIDDPATYQASVVHGYIGTFPGNQWLAGWESIGESFAIDQNKVQP